MSGYDSADVLDQDTKEVYTSGYDSASDLSTCLRHRGC